MKKLLFIIFFILLCNIIFSQTNNNSNQPPLKPLPMMDKINKECLATLYLTNEQKVKVEKLQKEFYSIERADMYKMNQAFNEYKNAYKLNPNSKETNEKKNKVKKLADQIRKDYKAYEKKLFKILTKEQIQRYNMFFAKKRDDMRRHMRGGHPNPPPPPNGQHHPPYDHPHP